MIINNATFDSGVINSSLVPIFPNEAMNPVTAGGGYMGVGAGAPTLTDAAANVNAPQSGAAASGVSLNSANAAVSKAAGILGIPAVAFWILILGLVGYIALWKIHFSASVGD